MNDSPFAPGILILGTADWNQPIATNQHYMATELLQDFDVSFVNSLGLRRPELSLRDMKRMWNRIAHRGLRAGGARPTPEGLSVISPTVIPFHRGLASLPNRSLLKRSVAGWLNRPGKKILWTYSPVTYGLEDYADGLVYHCVDLLAEFPGIDRRVIDLGEKRMARLEFTAAGSSRVVVSHLRSQGFVDPIYWPNVADTRAIAPSGDANLSGRSIRTPSAFFAGNLTSKKIEFVLLERLLEDGIEVHLAGPVAEGGGGGQLHLNRLIQKGANYHGALPLRELAPIMRLCTVGLIPYALNSYTRGVSPLKTYEYLAAGLAVVSTRLPGIDVQPPHVVIADHGDFVNAVRRALPVVGPTVLDARVRIAGDHSWVQRGIAARDLASALIGGSKGIGRSWR